MFSIAFKETLFEEIKNAWGKTEIQSEIYYYPTIGEFVTNHVQTAINRINTYNTNITEDEIEEAIEVFSDSDSFDDSIYNLTEAATDYQFTDRFLITLLDDLHLQHILFQN